jgi:hypothetical protein
MGPKITTLILALYTAISLGWPGLEPGRPLGTADFKSAVSTGSTTIPSFDCAPSGRSAQDDKNLLAVLFDGCFGAQVRDVGILSGANAGAALA